MKFIITLAAILYSTYAISQRNQNNNYGIQKEIPKTEITTCKLVGQNYELTITSTRKFYVGGNVHILNVGTKKFKRSRIDPVNGKSITFLIPENEFHFMVEGNEMWMSYGDKTKSRPITNMDLKSYCETNPETLWYLGKFDKSILK
jgi:hypothetical protein